MSDFDLGSFMGAAAGALYQEASVQGVTPKELADSLRSANRTVYGNRFEPGQDRSPAYSPCMCYNRLTGGDLLHPGGNTDPGPCYFDESDQAGFTRPSELHERN